MRKLITLMAALVVAIVANAQVLVSYEHTAELPAGIEISGTTVMKNVKIHTNTDGVDCIQFANGYTTDGALNGNCAVISTDGGFKAGDVVEIAGFFNNADDTKNSAFVIYVQDSSEKGYTVLWTSEKLINGRLVDDEPRVDTYVLEQDAEKLYIARSGNTGTNIYTLKITRGGNADAALTNIVNITSDPENNYYSGDLAFEWAPIAEALGLADAAAVQALINEGGNVYIELADGPSNAYTGNTNEFWMSQAGVPQGYGDEGTSWFAGISFDVEEGADVSTGVVDVYMGQMPDVFKNIYEPSTLKAVLSIVNGDKKVCFNITLNVNAAEKVDLPEPVTTLANLNIIGTVSADVAQYVRPNYDSDKITVSVAGMADAFGVSGTVIQKNIDKFLFAKTYDDVSETVNADLSNAFTAGAPGWWYVAAFDSETGKESDELVSGAYANGMLYMEAISYDPETEEISFNLGQYPGKMEDGAVKTAKFYVVCGDKAWEITAQLSTTNPPTSDFTEMVKMGETTVEYETVPDNSYAYGLVEVDLDAVAEAMGCTTGDLALRALAGEGALSSNSTANNGGYWMTKTDGYVCAWGAEDCGFFIEPETSTAIGTLHFGQYPNAYAEEVGKTFSYQLYYIFGSSYYVVNVNFTVKSETKFDGDKEIVSTEAIDVQLQPNADGYELVQKTDLDIEYIEKLLGTTDVKLYGQVAATDSTEVAMSTDYSCTPYPGFWMSAPQGDDNTVYVSTFSDASFGMTYANGIITWYNVPASREVGNSYKTTYYLVNEETGKAIEYIMFVNFVDEVAGEVSTVLESEVTVQAPSEQAKDGAFYIDIDTEDLYEALGITNESFADVTIVAQKTRTSFYTTSIGETFGVNADGYYVSLDDPEALSITATVTNENGKPQLYIDAMDLDFTALETSAIVRFGIEYEGKRAVYEYEILGGAKTIGATDNTTVWWTAFSDFYTIKEGETAIVSFTNYSDKVNNWDNWILIAQKAGVLVNGAGDDEYFALRADNYGWGGFHNESGLYNNYDWNNFTADMDGAQVTVMLSIKGGVINSTAYIVTKDGKEYDYSYDSKNVGADSFTFFFTTEKGHMEDFMGLIFASDDPDAIVAPAAPAVSAAPAGIYTISGAKVNELQKGINIVKMEDGSVKKVMVK